MRTVAITLVLALVAVELSLGTRMVIKSRVRALEVLRGLRLRHFLLAMPTFVLVVAAALALILIPGLDWGWWSAIGGSGNVLLGVSGDELTARHNHQPHERLSLTGTSYNDGVTWTIRKTASSACGDKCAVALNRCYTRFMAKMLARVYARHGKHAYRTGMLIDTGSSTTALKFADAAALGFRCRKPTDHVDIGGQRVGVCWRLVSLGIEDTDCVGDARVAISTSRENDLPVSIIGSDFLQRTGGVVDLRRDRHVIMCDTTGRNPRARRGDVVMAKGERLRGR